MQLNPTWPSASQKKEQELHAEVCKKRGCVRTAEAVDGQHGPPAGGAITIKQTSLHYLRNSCVWVYQSHRRVTTGSQLGHGQTRIPPGARLDGTEASEALHQGTHHGLGLHQVIPGSPVGGVRVTPGPPKVGGPGGGAGGPGCAGMENTMPGWKDGDSGKVASGSCVWFLGACGCG
eukprot:453360-Pelagomonas_calceolata.AAC.6